LPPAPNGLASVSSNPLTWPQALSVHQYLWSFFSSAGDDGFNSTLKDTALKENVTLALKTLNSDISPDSHHLPLARATGVLLPEAHHIAQLYLRNHLVTKPPFFPFSTSSNALASPPRKGLEAFPRSQSPKVKPASSSPFPLSWGVTFDMTPLVLKF